MPAPQSPFEIFKATLNPRSQPVPTHLGLFWLEIGEDGPGRFIARFPMEQQGSLYPTVFSCKTGHLAFPTRAWGGNPLADPLKGVLSLLARFDAQVEPQKGMPATRPDDLPQPAGIQA